MAAVGEDRDDKRLAKFAEEHHWSTQKTQKEKVEWWRKETTELGKVSLSDSTITSRPRRCAVCWLRSYNCFCDEYIKARSELYENVVSQDNFAEDSTTTPSNRSVFRVCMYYHFAELGRSANTAHLFQALCPSITEPVVLGDFSAETALIDDIEREAQTGELETCVLYPSKDAVSLKEWLQSRPRQGQGRGIRVVALDGTYPNATRQLKYLQKRCKLRGIALPTVKLDLSPHGMRSQITGVMHQPSAQKICTFQAIVMAMRALPTVSHRLCDSLSSDLDNWLAHILKCKVKFGKTNPRRNKEVVALGGPTETVAKHLAENPPPTNLEMEHWKRKKQRNEDRNRDMIGQPSNKFIEHNVDWSKNDAKFCGNNISNKDVVLWQTTRFSVYSLRNPVM